MNGRLSPTFHMQTHDYLKSTLSKAKGGPSFSHNHNKNLPKNPDSCFGNYPRESRPMQKYSSVATLPPITNE